MYFSCMTEARTTGKLQIYKTLNYVASRDNASYHSSYVVHFDSCTEFFIYMLQVTAI